MRNEVAKAFNAEVWGTYKGIDFTPQNILRAGGVSVEGYTYDSMLDYAVGNVEEFTVRYPKTADILLLES